MGCDVQDKGWLVTAIQRERGCHAVSANLHLPIYEINYQINYLQSVNWSLLFMASHLEQKGNGTLFIFCTLAANVLCGGRLPGSNQEDRNRKRPADMNQLFFLC